MCQKYIALKLIIYSSYPQPTERINSQPPRRRESIRRCLHNRRTLYTHAEMLALRCPVVRGIKDKVYSSRPSY